MRACIQNATIIIQEYDNICMMYLTPETPMHTSIPVIKMYAGN